MRYLGSHYSLSRKHRLKTNIALGEDLLRRINTKLRPNASLRRWKQQKDGMVQRLSQEAREGYARLEES